MKRTAFSLLILAFLGALFIAYRHKYFASDVVAKVNDALLTRQEFDEILYKSRDLLKRHSENERRKKLVEIWIESQLAAQTKNSNIDFQGELKAPTHIEFEEFFLSQYGQDSGEADNSPSESEGELVRQRVKILEVRKKYEKHVRELRKKTKIWINPEFR